MSVSAIIVSFFTGPALKECLKAVRECAGIDETIVINNGNTAEIENWLNDLANRHNDVSIVCGLGNIGFGKACNRGAALARCDTLLFLNPDAVLQVGALTNMASALEKAETGSIAGARLVNKDGSEQRGGRRGRLTPWSALVGMTGLTRLERLHPIFADMHQEREPVPEAPIDVHAISGACMLMGKETFEHLSGFDEGYFLHVEDLDLCRRVRAQGGKVIFVPDAQVVHYGSTSKARRLVVDWHKAKGLTRYFYKFAHSPWERLGACLIAPPIIAAVMLRSALLSARQRLR